MRLKQKQDSYQLSLAQGDSLRIDPQSFPITLTANGTMTVRVEWPKGAMPETVPKKNQAKRSGRLK